MGNISEKKTKYMLFGMPQREIKSINLKIDEKRNGEAVQLLGVGIR